MPSAILNTTALDIVRGALLLIGEADANQPLDANQFADGLRALNFMVKAWQSQGLHLWTKTEGILFLDVGKTDYKLGPNGDEAANLDDFVNTQLSVAGVATDTILTVDATVGMLAADFVGIELDDGTRHWTTIVSVDSSTQITITVALPSGAAIDNTVYTFTTLIPRPIRILQVRRQTTGEDNEVDTIKWSRQEYFAQTNKLSQGQINNWYYTPELADGRIYVWQTASDVNQVAKFTYTRPINVNSDNSEQPDFPSEWFDILRFNLAARIGHEYTVDPSRLQSLKVDAKQFLDDALGYDREPDSLNIQPDFRGQ